MFKQLKRKFIWMIMLLLTVVLLGVCLAVFLSTASEEERQLYMALDSISLKGPGTENRSPLSLSAISLNLDKNGNLLEAQGVSLPDEQTLANLAAEVSAETASVGTLTIDGVSYAYSRQDSPSQGIHITLMDRSQQLQRPGHLALTLGGVTLFALGLLLLISIFFANRAVRPVQQAFEKQKQFIADASHDLKTPLTVIQTNLDVIEANQSESVAQQEKWLAYIRSQTGRMSRLVQDMLSLARLDDQEDRPVLSRVDFSELLQSQLLSFEAPLYEGHIMMHSSIKESVYVTGDAEKLETLVTTLLDNACKHTPSGGELWVSLEREKSKALLTVKNTGDGIAPEHIEKVFDRFFRADSARSQQIGGHGLGLSIAKSIVDLHRGKIWAQSEHGSYTAFFVELPVQSP